VEFLAHGYLALLGNAVADAVYLPLGVVGDRTSYVLADTTP
jgi:hypothetical protein